MPSPVLVIGGTGRTGRHVVEKLLERGIPARVLTRDPGRAAELFAGAEGVEVFEGDVTRPEGVRAAMKRVGGVVVIVESSNSDDAPNGPERAHYGGTRNVIAAADEAPGSPVHVVLVSQIYITRPGRYPEVANVIRWRARAEEAVRASGLPYTIVRPSWLTGEPGGTRGLRLEQGDAGDGRVSREDVAEVCVQASLNAEARGKTFEVYDGPGDPPDDWRSIFAALSADDPA